MKIEDNKPGPVEVRRNTPRDANGPRSVAPAATPPSAGPAASVSIGTTANAVAAESTAATSNNELSDVEILDKLRERIQKGDLDIDYSKVARSVVDEAVAAIRRHG